jgi:CubicO group peptidase (beta-lactamase class C family)
MRMETLLFFIVFSIFAPPLSAQRIGILDREKVEKIDRLMQVYEVYGEMSGALLVAQEGNVIYKKAFGFANREWNVPNAVDTKFQIGALTKQFTAVLVLQLIEEKQIRFDDKIADFLPSYRLSHGSKVTIEQLLTHTSGIPNYTELPNFLAEIIKKPITPMELVRDYCSGDLVSEKGNDFLYSNSDYAILGLIVERVTGKSYEENLRKRIFEPLQMLNTGYNPSQNLLPQRAAGYQKVGFQYQNAQPIESSVLYAAGGLYSTVEDLYKWDRALYGDTLLSKKMTKRLFELSEGTTAYGWYTESTQIRLNGLDATKAYKSGRLPGYSAIIIRLLDYEHSIILLCNSDVVPVYEIGEKIQATLFNLPYDLPQRSIASLMMKDIEQFGVRHAVEGYKALDLSEVAPLNYKENELNELGNTLMKANRLDDAIEIFKLNLTENPENYRAYDGLADALLLKGEKAAAQLHYEQSLKLNPSNVYAKTKLERL